MIAESLTARSPDKPSSFRTEHTLFEEYAISSAATYVSQNELERAAPIVVAVNEEGVRLQRVHLHWNRPTHQPNKSVSTT